MTGSPRTNPGTPIATAVIDSANAERYCILRSQIALSSQIEREFGMRRLVITSLLLALLVPAAWPQATTGTVSGTVRDQSGAVIPNAEVAITNTETNVTSRSRTTDAGVFFYPGVMAGSYRMTIDFTAMQKYEGRFTVQVSQSVVVDPVLHAGATVTAIEVKDVTPMVTVD